MGQNNPNFGGYGPNQIYYPPGYQPNPNYNVPYQQPFYPPPVYNPTQQKQGIFNNFLFTQLMGNGFGGSKWFLSFFLLLAW